MNKNLPPSSWVLMVLSLPSKPPRQGEKLAVALGARVKAMACWNFPTVYQVPFSLGSIDFKGAAQDVFDHSIERAFGVGLTDSWGC
ncbi:hypothetical protein CVS28_13610 [Arthrobacter glacialis]|nr:hypothetical protein CVS28_13610 [Arthrobacter glacialis]